MKNKSVKSWDDSHMKKTIACTVKTSDGITHSVNVNASHPSPVSQAMTYVSALYRSSGKGSPVILIAWGGQKKDIL